MSTFIQVSTKRIIQAEKIASVEFHPVSPLAPTDKPSITVWCDGERFTLFGENAVTLWKFMSERAVPLDEFEAVIP